MKNSKGLPESFSPPSAKHFDKMLRRIRAGRWDRVDPRDLKNLLMDLWSKFEVHHKGARKRWSVLPPRSAMTWPGRGVRKRTRTGRRASMRAECSSTTTSSDSNPAQRRSACGSATWGSFSAPPEAGLPEIRDDRALLAGVDELLLGLPREASRPRKRPFRFHRTGQSSSTGVNQSRLFVLISGLVAG